MKPLKEVLDLLRLSQLALSMHWNRHQVDHYKQEYEKSLLAYELKHSEVEAHHNHVQGMMAEYYAPPVLPTFLTKEANGNQQTETGQATEASSTSGVDADPTGRSFHPGKIVAMVGPGKPSPSRRI